MSGSGDRPTAADAALGRADKATPWFDQAIAAERYCCYQFLHFNLGRVFFMQGEFVAARRSFEQSLRHGPDYLPARLALEYLDAEYGTPLQEPNRCSRFGTVIAASTHDPATLALRIGHAVSSAQSVLNSGGPRKRADGVPRTRTGMTLVPLG